MKWNQLSNLASSRVNLPMKKDNYRMILKKLISQTRRLNWIMDWRLCALRREWMKSGSTGCRQKYQLSVHGTWLWKHSSRLRNYMQKMKVCYCSTSWNDRHSYSGTKLVKITWNNWKNDNFLYIKNHLYNTVKINLNIFSFVKLSKFLSECS